MTPSARYLAEAQLVLSYISPDAVERVVQHLRLARDDAGIVWTLGLGGSAATASHFVNDLRKLCDLDARCLTDNASETLARINDDGWDLWTIGALAFARPDDVLFVVSVGGGADGVSMPINAALARADALGMIILGVVGRDGGATAAHAHACVVIPPTIPERVTPHTEGLASVVCHAIVSHPDLQRQKTKW